jgi:hypothetical protein
MRMIGNFRFRAFNDRIRIDYNGNEIIGIDRPDHWGDDNKVYEGWVLHRWVHSHRISVLDMEPNKLGNVVLITGVDEL